MTGLDGPLSGGQGRRGSARHANGALRVVGAAHALPALVARPGRTRRRRRERRA